MTIDEPGYFERLARVESGHWWSRSMWRLASGWLGEAIRGRRGLAALDVGCGTGLSLVRLAGLREVSPSGRPRAGRRSPPAGRAASEGSSLSRVRRSNCPLTTNILTVVTCFDVFQHLPDGGDRYAAREIARVLRPGGVAVVRSNSAGFGPGRSRGGTAYRLGELVEVLEGAGLTIRRASYANGLPALAQEARGRLRFLAGARGRSWRAHPSGGGLRIDVPSPRVNRLMGGVSAFERRAMAASWLALAVRAQHDGPGRKGRR